MPFTTTQKQKKKPPPRPPPPKFTKYKSKSTVNLNEPSQSVDLIEWSPPDSPKPNKKSQFGGSVSSSFSSSTSSLASSKRSFDYEPPVTNNLWPLQPSGTSFHSYLVPAGSQSTNTRTGNSIYNATTNVSLFFGPTIIRPKVKPVNQIEQYAPSSGSPPMPSIPPPSPPKYVDIETPYGIALFDYPSSHANDLALQTGDVVILIRRVNENWLYGRVIDKEGIFPENFIDIQVPLQQEENIVTTLYDFPAQMPGDLNLKTGQKVRVTKKISDDWLFGESGGQTGQFPANFVNRVPKNLF